MVSSPKPPNPYATAAADQQAQTGAAIGSSIINNPNEYSNYGTVNYDIAGWEQVPDAQGKMTYVPRYNRTTKLSPDEQQIANYDSGTRYNLGRTATQQSAKLGDYLNTSIDTKSWQPWKTGYEFDGATDRPAIEKALMARQTEAMGKRSNQEDAQLAARGMAPGSSAYGSVDDARRREMTDAQQQAYLASGQEARSNYQTAMDYWGFANNTRAGQSQEAFALRNQPINEISALMSQAQVNMPQFAQFSRQGIGAASPGGYINQNYQAQAANAAATNQGLFGLAGAGLGAAGSYWGGK